MTELQQQLADLRARMARVLEECAEKYEKRPISQDAGQISYDEEFSQEEQTAVDQRSNLAQRHPRGLINQARAGAQKNPQDQASFHVEEWLPGQEIETDHGKHYESETLYASHRRHGSADIGTLAELPSNLLETLSGGAVRDVPVDQWVFLDTETTGLAGGTGTCAFLVGVGRITPEGFRVRQFFMRDYGEEASLLHALTRYLEPFRVLITYNGRTFDQPLLETRYRMNRARPPFSKLEHLDLLHGARRLWKLRYESCRLVELEQRVLGFERRGDVPGAMIPYIYFEYVRSGEMARLLPVFHHNALDILTLACLTGIVPFAFTDPQNAPLKHGAELAGIGRWLRDGGELEQARTLLRRAVDAGLPDGLLFKTLWDVALLERKLGCDDAALAVWTELAESRNPFQVKALEELAKHHEHCGKNVPSALHWTRKALEVELLTVAQNSPGLQKRLERLEKRQQKAKSVIPTASRALEINP